MAVRVLWLTKGLGPGGAERLLVELAGVLDRSAVDVEAAYVLPWKDHLAGELEAAGVPTTCLSRSRHHRRWPGALRRLLRERPFDVVHTHSPVQSVAARLVVRTVRARRRPVVMTTEHNTWTSHHLLSRWANRLTGRRDGATYAVTAEAAATVRGPAAARVTVLEHGIDVAGTADRPAGTRARIRSELGIGDDELVLGTVANFRAQKDYPTLLRAARRLADDGVAFRLVAVGQGPLEAEITALRDELDLGGHVILAGFRPDAVDVMAAADVFTLASAWEGLPVAVMEALALGLPIVATRVGGVAESLDESAAVLVAPGDPAALAGAWAGVLTDPVRRAALAAAARTAAPRFDIRVAANRLTATYLALAARRESIAPVAPSGASAARTRDQTVNPKPNTRGTDRRRGTDAGAVAIRPAEADDRAAIIALLAASLGWEDDARYDALFTSKHETNPFGPSYGWVAEDAGEVVAVRLFMRWRFRRGHVTVEAVRAVDTATHPDHQGRGLFRALTMHAVEQCRDDGIGFVFNTPNEQSRPGYLKMGWREVGRLPTALRPAGLGHLVQALRSRVPAERWSEPLSVGGDVGAWLDAGSSARFTASAVSSTDRTLRTDVDDHVRRWRYGVPELRYRVVDGGDAAVIVRLRRRGAGTELVVAERLGEPDATDALAARTARKAGASHAIRLGSANPRRGFLPLPGGGPILTWRALADAGPPPLANWDLELRDIELF